MFTSPSSRETNFFSQIPREITTMTSLRDRRRRGTWKTDQDGEEEEEEE